MKSDMLKVVLSYAPSEQQFLPVPPLGIAVLSQHLKNNGIENETIDLELELWLSLGNKSSEYASLPLDLLDPKKLPVEGIIEKLKGYDIVTISIMGKRQIPYSIAIAQMLKKNCLKMPYIIAGGAFFNEENAKDFMLLNKDIFDFIIVGEGWHSLPELIKKISLFETDYNIPGVVYRNKTQQIVSQENKSWAGELPMPNYSTINKSGYVLQQKKLYGIDDDSIIYHVLVGDRRCPYNCSFCRISNNTKKVKLPIEIADEMIELNKSIGAECFSLICNEMNPTEKYFCDFLDRLISYDKKLFWFCYLRPNKLSKKVLEKAKKAGCVLIRYGVESGSQKILDHMNKSLLVEEIEQIMHDTFNSGIWNHINIISGYLHECDKDIELTIDFLERNKTYIDSVRVNPFYIPINSPIHLNPQKYGIQIRDNTGSYIQFDEPNCPWEEKQKRIQESTEKVLTKCVESNINFAGILPFLVAKVVAFFDDSKYAKIWIKNKHSYLTQPISPDTAKWRLAHPNDPNVIINQWDEISGKRNSNYQTQMEKKNFEEDSY